MLRAPLVPRCLNVRRPGLAAASLESLLDYNEADISREPHFEVGARGEGALGSLVRGRRPSRPKELRCGERRLRWALESQFCVYMQVYMCAVLSYPDLASSTP